VKQNIVNNQSPPKIVIVGGGAGGLELATKLGATLGEQGKASILLVDRSPTHIWKPLLHEVAAGTLNAFHDEENYFCHAARNHYTFQLGALSKLNRSEKTITIAPVYSKENEIIVDERTITYDRLVIAVGSTSNDFGTAGASEHCIYLDSRDKADVFHRKFLNFYIAAHSSSQPSAQSQQPSTQTDVEQTDVEQTDVKQAQQISISIIGGGATGVELAAELHFAAQQYVRLGLKELDAKNVSISLIEAGPRILPILPEKIARRASEELAKLGVKVYVGDKVVSINKTSIETASGKTIPAQLKVWCAGIKAPEFLKQLDGLETNRINQLVVNQTLQTSLDDTIFSMGDCAQCARGEGYVPPRAQAAHQQAQLLAKNLVRSLHNKPLKTFQYKDHGSLVSLSREDSVGVLMGRLMGNVNIHGLLAKWIYLSLYRSHQLAIHGWYKTLILIISDALGRSTGQRTKLH